MRKPVLLLLALTGAILFVGCSGAPEEQSVPTEVAPAAEAVQTPLRQVGTVVAGAVATPIRGTATTTGTVPVATITPRATPTPGTPTATPTPAPSAGLIREAAALQEKLDALREAIASGDKDALLKAQKALLEQLPKAEAAAADDQSTAAEAFRSGLRDLRGVLAGDLAKLDSAVKGIAAVSGGSTRPARQTTATSNVQPITNLPRYAKDLADQVAAFLKAQEDGNVSDLLRAQKALLEELDHGEAALSSARTQQAQTVKSALDDLRNALGGDGVKYASAEEKLRQVAAANGTVSTTNTTTSKTVDLQPFANELNKRLGAYQLALEGSNADEIAKAQQALSDQINKAQEALRNDQSPRAARLREAFTALREAAAGDHSKIEAAKSALDSALSGQ